MFLLLQNTLLNFTKIAFELSMLFWQVQKPFRPLRKLFDEERALALGRIEADIHPQDVVNQFNVHRSAIIRLRDRHRATGTVSD